MTRLTAEQARALMAANGQNASPQPEERSLQKELDQTRLQRKEILNKVAEIQNNYAQSWLNVAIQSALQMASNFQPHIQEGETDAEAIANFGFEIGELLRKKSYSYTQDIKDEVALPAQFTEALDRLADIELHLTEVIAKEKEELEKKTTSKELSQVME